MGGRNKDARKMNHVCSMRVGRNPHNLPTPRAGKSRAGRHQNCRTHSNLPRRPIATNLRIRSILHDPQRSVVIAMVITQIMAMCIVTMVNDNDDSGDEQPSTSEKVSCISCRRDPLPYLPPGPAAGTCRRDLLSGPPGKTNCRDLRPELATKTCPWDQQLSPGACNEDQLPEPATETCYRSLLPKPAAGPC